jgi:hypothetical protein
MDPVIANDLPTTGQQFEAHEFEEDHIEFTSDVYWPCRSIPYEGNDQSPDANAGHVLHQLCDKCEAIRHWLKAESRFEVSLEEADKFSILMIHFLMF